VLYALCCLPVGDSPGLMCQLMLSCRYLEKRHFNYPENRNTEADIQQDMCKPAHLEVRTISCRHASRLTAGLALCDVEYFLILIS